METLGSKIKHLRLSRQLTLDELCNELNNMFETNINKSMVSKWENNKEEPRLSYVVKLAKFYNVSADYLIGLNTGYTKDELQEIENFKEYLLSKRK